MRNFTSVKGWKLFVGLTLLYALISYIQNKLFFTSNLLHENLNQQVEISRIEEMLNNLNRKMWMYYSGIPIRLFISVLYATVLVYIGVFFAQIKASFVKIFKAALIAEFIFVISAITRLVMLLFFIDTPKFYDLEIQPLSIMLLLNSDNIDSIYVYALSIINIFNIAYIFIFAYLIAPVLNQPGTKTNIKYAGALKIVAIFYTSGLLLWVLIKMFLMMNFSNA